jgi:hypothetical protein
MPETEQLKTFRVVDLPLLLQMASADPSIGVNISRRPWLPPIDVSIPSVSLGQTETPEIEYTEWPPNEKGWKAASNYNIWDGDCWTLENAVLHGELGIITVGDFLIRESLYLALPEHHGYVWVDGDHLQMPSPAPSRHVASAVHALCGYVGNRNYAHWWVNIMPVIGVFLTGELFSNTTLVLPNLPSSYQRQTLDLVPEVHDRFVEVGPTERLHCDRLEFVPRLTAADYTPHPGRMTFINEIKLRAKRTRQVRAGCS